VEISFQLETLATVKKKWLEFISQHKKNYAFAIVNQFIVSLSAPALTHCISTTFIEYRCMVAESCQVRFQFKIILKTFHNNKTIYNAF
jgi:hypothetical protein